jgi:hypothetical protein
VDLSQFFPLPSGEHHPKPVVVRGGGGGGGGGSSTAKKLISGTTIFFGDIVLKYLESINIFMLKNYLQFFGLTMFTSPIVISVLACYWAGQNNWALIGQERYTCRLAKYSASLAKYGLQNFRSAVEKLIFWFQPEFGQRGLIWPSFYREGRPHMNQMPIGLKKFKLIGAELFPNRPNFLLDWPESFVKCNLQKLTQGRG